jgi:endonuclease/exonuclease/phosphatase family metal-dependent hydrolase
MWAAVGAALPWTWFLVRDLGPAMQLVALALPILVAAAILGVVISAIDDKRVMSLLVVASLVVFGWTTVMGPRGTHPSRAPQDPVRVVEGGIPADGTHVQTVITALRKEHADVAILSVPSKKDRAAAAAADGFETSVVEGGFVVLSAYPVKILPLPKGLPKGLVTRIEVDRAGHPFVVYAARVTDALQSALDEPLNIERMQASALDEQLPVVIIGGLGVSDRSTEYRQLDAAFRDALRADSTAGNTLVGLLWSPLMLRSDYVFTSRAWCATDGTAFPLPGVDHAAVVASVGACPAS